MKRPKCKIVQVEAQSLRIHPEAQRDLNPTKAKKFTQELDLDAIGVFHAVEYPINGVTALWVIDGHHRHTGLINNDLGGWIVTVMVHLDVRDDARAHELFLKLMDRTALAPFDKFKNELGAGQVDAVGVSLIAQENGLKVDRNAGDGSVCCVNALKKIWAKDSGVALGRTLRTSIEAWGRTAASMEGKLIEGIGLICSTYNGSIDHPSLVKKLAKFPGGASGLVGKARMLGDMSRRTLSRCIAEIVVETYNSGRRSGKLDPL